MSRMCAHPGVTLVELLATLVVLAVMAGVAGVAYRRAEPVTSADEAAAQVAVARQRAIRERKPVTVTLQFEGRPLDATAFPDGSIAFDGPVALDLFTGGAVDEK